MAEVLPSGCGCLENVIYKPHGMRVNSPEILFEQFVKDGDEKAYKALFFEFFTPLCHFASRYVDSEEDCEDLVQDVFFHIWEQRRNLFIRVSVRNFLMTSVKNACIDFLRRTRTMQNYVDNEMIKEEPVDMDPHLLFTISELEKKINDTLALLPENVRKTFELNRYEGKTYPEIADVCQISVKTVEAHISRALKLLREELKDYLHLLALFI